jgi:hypothetical protein
MARVFSLSPRAFVAGLWRHRDLVVQMTERDTRSRMVLPAEFWSIANPLLMLAVYVVSSAGFSCEMSPPGRQRRLLALILSRPAHPRVLRR